MFSNVLDGNLKRANYSLDIKLFGFYFGVPQPQPYLNLNRQKVIPIRGDLVPLSPVRARCSRLGIGTCLRKTNDFPK